MIDIIELDFNSEKTIYIQLYEQIVLSIAQGELKPGDSLPAVRTMAEEIGINLHTVNKAYGILRDEGYISMDRRKGAVVSEVPIRLKDAYQKELEEDLELIVAKAYLSGLDEKSFIQLTQSFYRKCGEKNNE